MTYGDKRDYPPIEVWHSKFEGGDGKVVTTTWSPTVWDARKRYAEKLGVPVTSVAGRKANA